MIKNEGRLRNWNRELRKKKYAEDDDSLRRLEKNHEKYPKQNIEGELGNDQMYDETPCL